MNDTHWLLDVFVAGRPAPQGSIRAIVHRSTGRAVAIKDNNARQKSWRQDVRDAVTEAWAARSPIDGPVEIRIEFVMPRPLSSPKRSTPPAIRKPDGDKLERAVWDSLTDVVWVDDARVVDWSGSKRLAEIGETPGAWIRARPAAVRSGVVRADATSVVGAQTAATTFPAPSHQEHPVRGSTAAREGSNALFCLDSSPQSGVDAVNGLPSPLDPANPSTLGSTQC